MDDVDDFSEFETLSLAPLLRVIDEQIARINSACERDPETADMLGWYDDANDLAGLGFVACQQLLNRAYRSDPGRKWQDERKDALAVGPIHASGVSYARAIDAAANFWKHHGEWIPRQNPTHGKETRDVLERIYPNRDSYVMANVLHALVTPGAMQFANLLPRLEEWVRQVLSQPRP